MCKVRKQKERGKQDAQIKAESGGGESVRLIDGDALCMRIEEEFDGVCVYDVSGNEAAREFCDIVDVAPTIDAIPVEWLNERHRKCCEEGDTDLMDAITVLCNEYHVWQKEQEAQDE
jgi:hypothetical protein